MAGDVFHAPAAIETGLHVARADLMASSNTRTPDAEALAIEGLGFIAADPDLLPRFLALTGIEASSIRMAAREPGFLAGVLNFILAHEPTLLSFAASAGISPDSVAAAARALPFGSTDDHQASP